MRKQFTKQDIINRFMAAYPDGDIYFDDKGVCCFTKYPNSRMLRTKGNLYDIAQTLHLAPKSEIAAMKKAAGYYAYQ